MGRPKLSEDEKREPMPLRLKPAEAERLDEIAELWGEKIGKEVKRATVAREMVLIGLSVFMALRNSKILADVAQCDDDSQQARIAEIAAVTNDLFIQSRKKNIDPDLTEQAIIQSLNDVKNALLNAPSIPATSPIASAVPPRQYNTEPIPNRNRKKGGVK